MSEQHYMKDDIELHSDSGYRSGRPAINVKLYDFPGTLDGYSEEQVDSAFRAVQESWWEWANDLAKQYGFEGVYSEGRSGGWCVPYYSRNVYVDPQSFGDRSQFLAFQRRIRASLRGVWADVADFLKHNT